MSDKSKAARDNRANQLNPTHPVYHQARGESLDTAQELAEQVSSENRADQPNPNNSASQRSRERNKG